MPGQFIPGADSHSRAYGAYGAVGIGVGSTTLGFGWSTGYIYFTLAKARRVEFRGKLQPWVSGKDIVLELLRQWGAQQSQGMSVELVDADKQLPIAYRNTIANMMAEAEAQNGIFAPDEITYAWYRQKGITDLPYPAIAPGAEREVRDRRERGPVRRSADDRQAVQPRQRVSSRRSRARAPDVRQGDDWLLHQRQLRRSAAGGARLCAPRGRSAPRESPASWRSFRDPAASAVRSSGRIRGSAANRSPRSSARSAAASGSRGAGRASARARTRSQRASAPSRRSIATGRTAWASAARATSPALQWLLPRRSSATWRRRPRWDSSGKRKRSACDVRDAARHRSAGGALRACP